MILTVILAIGALGIVMLILSAALKRQARPARPVDLAAMRAEVLAAVDRDDLVEAVRIYRRDTGARLLEASDAVQQIAVDRR